jgi:ribosomal protein S18 acetylase RimI-like enzyme
MTEDEFAAFKAFLAVEYEQDVARGLGVPVEEVHEQAQQQIEALMKDGIKSPDHRYWKVIASDGGAVGDLWVMLRPRQEAFIYFIGIDEAYRGQGYGEQTMNQLEVVMRSQGIIRIALNVFGDNAVAQRLYQRVGYRAAAITMVKDI